MTEQAARSADRTRPSLGNPGRKHCGKTGHSGRLRELTPHSRIDRIVVLETRPGRPRRTAGSGRSGAAALQKPVRLSGLNTIHIFEFHCAGSGISATSACHLRASPGSAG